jgi:hypothetical protein
MPDMGKVRKLLEAVRMMAVHLSEDEISDIALILNMAAERLEREGRVRE